MQHLLSRFLAKVPLPQMSCLSANDKDDNEMIPGAVQRSGIYLMVEKKPTKPQPGDHLKKVKNSHCLKWGPYLQLMLVELHSPLGREKKGKKERTERGISPFYHTFRKS